MWSKKDVKMILKAYVLIWSIRPLSKNTHLFVFNTDLMIVDSGDGDSLILMF